MREAIARCELDLSGLTVLTEAASGAYAATSLLAALAGARLVFAFARDSHYGSVAEITHEMMALARMLSVETRIEIVTKKRRDILAAADIITNSGHLRPIDRAMIDCMKPTAVVPLMYEAWESRAGDVDLAACAARGIAVAGTNERHPAVDVFSFLGPVAARLLADAGIASRGRRIVVMCDNPFRDFLVNHFVASGARVESIEHSKAIGLTEPADAILVAMTPRLHVIIGEREAGLLARRHPGALVAQFWGDIDRKALTRHHVSFWPLQAPPPSHQGVMLSSIGDEPVVRLQTGGLKVGEVMARARMSASSSEANYMNAVAAAVASGFGQALES